MRDRDLIRSASRILTVLEALNRERAATVARLQAETSLPKPTIVRLLHTLIDGGYALKLSRTEGYAVAERALRLSEGFEERDRVVVLARPLLDAFTARRKWLTNLQTYDRGAMLGRYATSDSSPLSSDPPAINRRSPMLTTAHGQVYLAFCSGEERALILAMLRASKKPANAPAHDPLGVETIIATVQQQGYALRTATPRDRVVGFAVPVMKAGGVAATMGLRYFRTAMSPVEAVDRYLEPLRAMAAELSEALEAPVSG